MKKYFLAGLAILLPIYLTYLILLFIVNVLSTPLFAGVEAILVRFNLLTHDIFFIQGESIVAFTSKVISLCLLFALIILVGVVCKRFFIVFLLKYMDNLFHRIPLVKPIYTTTKEMMNKLFKGDQPRFTKVVLIPFPHPKALSLALVTHEEGDRVYVLLAGTPNPTLGFVLAYPRAEVIPTNIKVEDAVKMVTLLRPYSRGLTKFSN